MLILIYNVFNVTSKIYQDSDQIMVLRVFMAVPAISVDYYVKRIILATFWFKKLWHPDSYGF